MEKRQLLSLSPMSSSLLSAPHCPALTASISGTHTFSQAPAPSLPGAPAHRDSGVGPQGWGHFSGASGSLSSPQGPKGGVLSPHLSEDKWTVLKPRSSHGPGDQSLTVHQADGREAVSSLHTSRVPGPIAGTICFSSSPVQRGKLRLRVAQGIPAAKLGSQSWPAGWPQNTYLSQLQAPPDPVSLPQPPSDRPAVSAGRRQVPGPEENPGAWGPWSETLCLSAT